MRQVWDTAGVTEDLALADLERATAGAGAIVAGIAPSQWAAPTPCAGLDVRALVNHLVTGNLYFTSLVSQAPRPDRDADQLGDDPLGAFGRAAAELRAAYARPGVLGEMYTGPFGPAPGVALVCIRITEHLGHGWDLARAGSSSPADRRDQDRRSGPRSR